MIFCGRIGGHLIIVAFYLSAFTHRCPVQSSSACTQKHLCQPRPDECLHSSQDASARSPDLLLLQRGLVPTVAISSSRVAEGLPRSSTRHTDQSQQSRDDMSGVQEGQGRPPNPLSILSPSIPSSHSLTLTAVCAAAPSFCGQKHHLVTPPAPPARRRSEEVEISLPVHSAIVPPGHQCRMACPLRTTDSGCPSAGVPTAYRAGLRRSTIPPPPSPATLEGLIATLQECTRTPWRSRRSGEREAS